MAPGGCKRGPGVGRPVVWVGEAVPCATEEFLF